MKRPAAVFARRDRASLCRGYSAQEPTAQANLHIMRTFPTIAVDAVGALSGLSGLIYYLSEG